MHKIKKPGESSLKTKSPSIAISSVNSISRQKFSSIPLTVQASSSDSTNNTKKVNNKLLGTPNIIKSSDCTDVQNELLAAFKLKTPVLDSKENLQSWFLKSFACQDCTVKLIGPYEYIKHQREAHRWILQACKTCQIFISTEEDIDVHLAAAHSNINKPSMTVSEDYFAKLLDEKEVLSESTKSQFECLVCDTKFVTWIDLKCHQEIMEHKPVGCKDCKIYFACEDQLHCHLKSHKHYACEFCSANFYSKEVMIKHVYKHPESKKLKCNVCCKLFITFAQFRSHKHTTDLLCEKCGFQTDARGVMNRHIMLKHKSKEELYKVSCSSCPKKCRTISMMMIHHKRVHLKERKFQCDNCSKSFFKKADLEKHMSLHTKVFKHKCQVCKARFTRADNLRFHLKNTHRYCCPICRVIFPTAKAVINHRSTHSIEETVQAEKDGYELYEKFTDFQCNICSKFLASNQSLGFHLLTHQGVTNSRKVSTKQNKDKEKNNGKMLKESNSKKKTKTVISSKKETKIKINRAEIKLETTKTSRKSKRIDIRNKKKSSLKH